MNVFASKLFGNPPKQWGLRGDKYLWDELAKHFTQIQVCASSEEFLLELSKAFQKLTGDSLDSGNPIHVSRYDHGGMSSGMVDVVFWKEELVPLLVKRFKSLNEKA